MTLPVKKYVEYSKELVRWHPPTVFRLRQIIKELGGLLKAASPEDAYGMHLVIGGAHCYLGQPSDGARHFEICVRLSKTLDATASLGWAYLMSGRTVDALNAWVEASELGGDRSPIILSNLAEVFAALGREDDAWDMLRGAMSHADFENIQHLFMLAMQSAELGADELAVELFARFMSVLVGKAMSGRSADEFIRKEWPAGLTLELAPALDVAIRRMLSFGPALATVRRHAANRSQGVSEEAAASALSVFESMRSARGRATEEAMTAAAADGSLT